MRGTPSLPRGRTAPGLPPPYIVQHLSGAVADYQNGRMSGADDLLNGVSS
ncbi:hypothetical protein [Streptomyces sp. NPDC057582]